MKRALLIGLSAAALSGCSWLGYGGHDTVSNDGYYGGQYAPVAPAAPCCGTKLSKWNVEAGVGPSFIVGGQGVTGDKINPSIGTNISPK